MTSTKYTSGEEIGTLRELYERKLALYCPFCGCEARWEGGYDDDGNGNFEMGCKKCGAHTDCYEHLEEAFFAWNRRVSPLVQELLKALEATVGAKCWSCDYVGKMSGEPCPETCDYKRFNQLIAKVKGETS